jgi:hypothetical protein
MLIFLYFHKAIRAELEGLHGAAVRLATERAGDVGALADRCRSFVNIYKHHCDAEDAVRLPPTSSQLRFIRAPFRSPPSFLSSPSFSCRGFRYWGDACAAGAREFRWVLGLRNCSPRVWRNWAGWGWNRSSTVRI